MSLSLDVSLSVCMLRMYACTHVRMSCVCMCVCFFRVCGGRYVTTVAVSVFSSLHGQGTTKITLGEMKGSNLVDAFELVRTQYSPVFVIVSLLSLLFLLVHGCMDTWCLGWCEGCVGVHTPLLLMCKGAGYGSTLLLFPWVCECPTPPVSLASVSMKVLV